VYGDGSNVRDWIYVLDHCRAVDLVLSKGRPGEAYNIGGNSERRNIDIARLILRKLDKPEDLITFVKDRPGHDRRYAIDASKIKQELGWKPEYTFEDGFDKTLDWYATNAQWVEGCTSGEYLTFYERNYGARGEGAAGQAPS